MNSECSLTETLFRFPDVFQNRDHCKKGIYATKMSTTHKQMIIKEDRYIKSQKLYNSKIIILKATHAQLPTMNTLG